MLLISTISSAQLQNTSFENWENPIDESIGGNRPVGWIRFTEVPGSELMNFYNPPVTEAQHGNYALRLSVWYTYDKDMARQKAPINYRPAALTGFYTYTQNSVFDPMADSVIDDEAKVTVRLTKTDPSSGVVTLIGSGLLTLHAVTSFEPFSCPIAYTSEEIPDEIEVVLECTLMKRGIEGNSITATTLSGLASFLTVDNLALTGDPLAVNNVVSPAIRVYPNPAPDVVFVAGFEGDARVYGLLGNLMCQLAIQDGKLDLRNLPAGTYLLSLKNGQTSFSTTLIKN